MNLEVAGMDKLSHRKATARLRLMNADRTTWDFADDAWLHASAGLVLGIVNPSFSVPLSNVGIIRTPSTGRWSP